MDKQAADAAELIERQTEQGPDPYPKADVTDFDSAELLGENLVIQRWNAAQMSEGGIVLIDGSQEVPSVGWVIKIGRDVPKGMFCEGDTVVFATYAIQALPDVSGRPGGPKDFSEYNYLRYQDVILRYPLNPVGEIEEITTGGQVEIKTPDVEVAARRGVAASWTDRKKGGKQ